MHLSTFFVLFTKKYGSIVLVIGNYVASVFIANVATYLDNETSSQDRFLTAIIDFKCNEVIKVMMIKVNHLNR